MTTNMPGYEKSALNKSDVIKAYVQEYLVTCQGL